MQETLVERLGLSNQFIKDSENFQVSLDKKKLSKIEIGILREFYEGDQLAYKVAAGEESYGELIKPIEEKYNSFWKRIWIQRTNEIFDNDVRRVIKSMNNVGLEYINPEIFTTDERKKDDKHILLHSLKFGVFFVGLAVFGTYIPPENYSILIKSIPAIVAGTVYLGNKSIRHTLFIKPNLENLQESAQKTDKFLTQPYLKLPHP